MMDSTTLVTFLFQAPPEARTVELLGSWDRFEQPYRMHNDRRRGVWSGIFRFENISFDGDDFIKRTKPRSGGLRQGGTYFYYYRINSYDDAFDERQPCTLACPLIPGQVVNIIDVPMECTELPARCHSVSNIEGSLTKWQQQQTLDPATKYAMLEPPPLSKIHARSLSDGTLQGRLENPPSTIVEETIARPSTPDFDCPDFALADRIDSSRETSRDSSVYSRNSTCSAGTGNHTDHDLLESFDGLLYSTVRQPCALPTSTICEPSSSSRQEANEVISRDFAQAPAADLSHPEIKQTASDTIAYIPLRKVSTLSIGPFSVQNIQFYNESRPGTRLNEDPEQYRPRVYSLPNSELRTSEEGESQEVSPPSTALQRPLASQTKQEVPTPDSDVVEFELASPSFSVATASSEGEASPLRLSPQTSIKRFTSAASRNGGGAITGIANRFRSLRVRRRHSASRHEADLPATRPSPPAFLNYALPEHTESDRSLAKARTNPSARAQSEHGHLPAPTVFDDEPPMPRRLHGKVEGSLSDDIFSELGYLGASIG